MPRNGSGVYSPPGANYPAVASTLITAANRNAVDADIATALTQSVAVDGQSTISANLPMAGFKLTGVGAATARTDAASLANIQDGTGVYAGTVGGTADVITITPSPAITAYAAGQTFRFIASGANTTNVTVNVNGLGAKAITKNGTTALSGGDIQSGAMVEITYDGTRFIIGTVGFVSPPLTQNSKSAAYTTVLSDGQKHILHPTADNNARTFTIDSNANVAYPIGTMITFVNEINTVTIAITSDTMTLAGTATTGSRTLAANGIATALKIATTSWIISGTGLS